MHERNLGGAKELARRGDGARARRVGAGEEQRLDDLEVPLLLGSFLLLLSLLFFGGSVVFLV